MLVNIDLFFINYIPPEFKIITLQLYNKFLTEILHNRYKIVKNDVLLETDQVARSVAKTLYDKNEQENYVTYLGILVGIKRAQFGAEIIASSYVIYRDKVGNEYTVYSLYKNGSTSVNKLLGL